VDTDKWVCLILHDLTLGPQQQQKIILISCDITLFKLDIEVEGNIENQQQRKLSLVHDTNLLTAAILPGVLRSSSVCFFAPKMRNCGPQPVWDGP
jgi:hypothetical protein